MVRRSVSLPLRIIVFVLAHTIFNISYFYFLNPVDSRWYFPKLTDGLSSHKEENRKKVEETEGKEKKEI